MLVRFQTDREEQMPWVEVRTRDQPPAARLGQITAGLGLFGEAYVFQGSFYGSVARLLASLPLWGVFFFLRGKILGWCRRSGKSGWIFWGKILILLGAAVGIYYSVSFTSDFIPARWSDFGFWGRKAAELAGWSRARRNFPQIYWEGEVLRCVGRMGAWALGGLGGVVGVIWHMQKVAAKD